MFDKNVHINIAYHNKVLTKFDCFLLHFISKPGMDVHPITDETLWGAAIIRK